MTIDDATREALAQEIKDLWSQRTDAEKIAEQTPAALRVKTLSSQWCAATERLKAMDLLLKYEKETQPAFAINEAVSAETEL